MIRTNKNEFTLELETAVNNFFYLYDLSLQNNEKADEQFKYTFFEYEVY